MAEEQIIATVKTSQISNSLYFIVQAIIFALLLIYQAPIKEIISNLLSFANNLFLHKPDESLNSFTNILFFLVVLIPLFLSSWRALKTYCKTYTFTSERLFFTYGVLNSQKDQIEYFRVKDFYSKYPLVLKPFNLSHFYLISTDRTHPFISIKAIKNLPLFEDELRRKIEESTQNGKGREVDIV